MKRLSIWIVTTIALITLLALAGRAANLRTPLPLPADLQPISPEDVPSNVLSVRSMQFYGIWPPIPRPHNWTKGFDLYWSPSLQKLFEDDLDYDYATAQQEAHRRAALNGSEPQPSGPLGNGWDGSCLCASNLWLLPPVLQGSNVLLSYFSSDTNSVYEIYTVSDLRITNWTHLTDTVPGQTNIFLSNVLTPASFYVIACTNDTDGDSMSDAYELLSSHTDPNTPDAPLIVFQPLSQSVDWGDTVTFSVIARGPSPLRYQWLFGGTSISGATNSSFTIAVTQPSDAGEYSVEVSSPALLTVLSSNATLTVQSPVIWPIVRLTGSRQNYTFKNGVTYYLGSRVELYGTTTIEGGAVIKRDWYCQEPRLAVMGTLVCKTDDPYFPAFLTSVDDDTVGEFVEALSSGNPRAISNGVPYLDLTYVQDATPTLNNLRIRYADQGLATPTGKRLDVWNCQFSGCNSGVVANWDSTVRFHNVLFGNCGTVVAGSTNFAAIEAEHVTADTTSFWSQVPPTRINLTNSIVVGTIGSGPTLVTDHTAINPASPVFQQAGSGHYYLTNSSPYRRAGSASISPRLATEFRQKTTQPPLVFPEMIDFNGELTLNPQVARYTNGAPDYGYYYAALDYTVGWITNWGIVTILPGTAIGFRNEYSSAHNLWTWWGFDLREGSQFVSRGLATKPNVFVDVQFVQEQLAVACVAFFVPDYWPLGGPNADTAPILDFRFSRFYAKDRHVWSGYDTDYNYMASPDSRVDWTMRDCSFYGGRITLGEPDWDMIYGAPPPDWVYGPCSVSWINNLFEGVAIDVDPTLYQFGFGVNCDMTFSAYNNLFRGGLWLHLEPVPGSDWVFKDNLFDKVNFIQGTNAPVDFGYNGYWPLSSAELDWLWYYYPWPQANSQFLVTTNGGGGNEQVLTTVPPYQSGPLGNYYLPMTTPLYHAGSRTPGDAGLHQYTTGTDQIKEGEEFPSGHNLSIGLHYIATTNASATVPKDSDGDGVPDFVEDRNGNGALDYNETSPGNAMTDGVTADAYSSVYDGVDLSGSGLSGLAKKVLGLNPLDPSNPLTLTQVITGDEPVTVTFEVPASYDAVTAAGFFHLNRDGFGATGEQLLRATNGHCLLVFNQYFDPPGLHYLSANFRMGGQAADGPLLPFSSGNELQFEAAGAMFDEYGAYLDAKLFVQQADYVINLYDTSTTNETFILSITNTTYNGVIQEDWGVTNANGTPFTGTSVRAEFDVATGAIGPMGAGAKKPSKPLQRATNSLSEWGLNFDFAYMYTPTNGGLSTAFTRGGAVWNGMQGVVDVLIAPRYGWDHYNSDFNRFLPATHGEYPGYITSRTTVTNELYPTLISAKQFYCYAHGSSNVMANFAGDTYITSVKSASFSAIHVRTV